METKTKPPPAPAVSLAHADKQINSLFQKHLPSIPHIFFVPTDNPYRNHFPHENLNIPFDHREIPRLQYMTLISNGDRGVGASKGASDWEEEIYGKSPLSAAGHSSTSTPARDLKKPSQKISFGDYRNYKQTGVKPSPRPTATPEQRGRPDAPGHSRNTSFVSAITPMGRVPSSEGGDVKSVAKVNSVTADKVEKALIKDIGRPMSRSTDAKEAEKPPPITNGHRESIVSKHPIKDPRASSKPQPRPIKEPMKHPLPPRPQSPPRSNTEHKKRPLESGETHPEKRVKIGYIESKIPSSSQKESSQKDTLRKLEAVSETKPSPSKSQKPSTGAAPASPLPKKPTSTTKPINTKAQPTKSSTSEKPLEIPPLLSPLPADLEPHFAFPAAKKSDSDKNTPPKTPSAKKDLGSDTIVVKQPHIKSNPATSSPLSDPPKSSPPPFVLPRLLSPDLPEIVEEELLRLQQKSAATLNTVEARHEKARLPDTPGVARKTTKVKTKGAIVGHPPKKEKVVAESSKLATVHERESKKTLIVKIPYKKRNSIHIQRILALTQKPRGQMEKLEAGERLARERSTSAPPPKDDSESEEDVPLATSRATKAPSAPAITTSKKRPSGTADQPAPKRPKLPENVDVAKASPPVTPAFKSPALSAPPSAQKSLLATPKKGDAMKSVAMRRVDSNDGLARTPQNPSTSTPASAEKPRPNGIDQRPNLELDRQLADEAKFYPMGTMLKRKMDSLISPKNRDSKDPIPDSERKAGLCIGVESLMAYMLAFHARDRIAHLRAQPPNCQSWDGWLKLQVFLLGSTRHYMELHALIEQMGAVAREILNRNFMEHLGSAKESTKIEKLVRDTRENSRARDAAWVGVKRNEKVLRELGVKKEMLGPWSTCQEAVNLAESVLGAYSAKEGLGWSPDPQFVAAKGVARGASLARDTKEAK